MSSVVETIIRVRIGLVMLIALIGVVTARPAHAAATCSATITNGSFGVVTPAAGAQSTASLSFSCTGLTPLAAVTLCPGLDAGSGGSSGASRLLSGPGSASLAFQIYQDPGHTVSWGSPAVLAFGQSPTITTTASATGTASAAATLYLALPAQGAAAPGAYSSTFSGESFVWGLNVASCAGVTLGVAITPAPFSISATIQPSCVISATAMNFGAAGVLSASVTAQSAISASCTPGTPYSIALSNGQTGTGPTTRLMTFASGAITYGLYADAAFTEPWGSQAAGVLVAGVGSGAPQLFSAYGLVPAQPTPAPGTYVDTVVATVTY